MTVSGRDMSDFDTNESISGFQFVTHKATEGTLIAHEQYGPRLNRYRGAVPVLGAYHVLRTPGNDGHGSLAAQLDYWVARMDDQTPWWRTVPFMLQVDAEKWPYDNVLASTVLSFCDLLAHSGLPGWKVAYASRGQYGDSLTGCPLPLWNADYRGSSAGLYPGDGWTSINGQPAGWASYSGRAPALLQYTSTPCDKNAFRGSLNDFLALIGGDPLADSAAQIQSLWDAMFVGGSATGAGTPVKTNPSLGDTGGNSIIDKLDYVIQLLKTSQAVTLTADQLAALENALTAAVVARHDALTAADEPVIRDAVAGVLRSVSAQ